MRRYSVVRTDKGTRDFVLQQLEGGQLRQGWGWKPTHDLRLLRRKLSAGEPLTDDERAAWRNRRLLDTEVDGFKVGDVVVLPNLPAQGKWMLARVAGPYSFNLGPVGETGRVDYGHVVPVDAIRNRDGSIGIVEADNANVDARLRASMRNMSRMWSIDALAPAVEQLISAIEGGADTIAVQPENEKFDDFFSAMRQATWEAVRKRYKAAEFEQLVRRLFERVYAGGRVEHWGGAGEKGADLIVFTQDALGIEYKIAVQVKLHDGEHDDVHAIEQIRTARTHHNVDAGVVLSTAVTTSKRFDDHQAKVESELGIDVRVILRDEFLDLLLTHLGASIRTA